MRGAQEVLSPEEAAMRLDRLFVPFALGLCVVAGSPGALAEAEEESCVTVHESSVERGLDYDFSNSCELRYSCSLTATITCQDGKGQVTGRDRRTLRVSLDANASRVVSVSAAACVTGNYRIDGVAWRCDPVK